MYKLQISSQAKKEIKELKVRHKRAILQAIRELKEDPGIGKLLMREYAGKLSYRFSIYRIVYIVHNKDRVVEIISARHRANSYN